MRRLRGAEIAVSFYLVKLKQIVGVWPGLKLYQGELVEAAADRIYLVLFVETVRLF